LLGDHPRFRVQRGLGTGGFGLVYEAFDLERHARVALKLLRRSDPGSLFRLKREFRALADLSHVNLVTLHELVADQDPWFIAMELVDGSDFISYVTGRSSPDSGREDSTTRVRAATSSEDTGARQAPIVERASREIACNLDRLQHATRQLAEALSYLHHAGKLHCDIKPPNVLVRTDGLVKLLDFGLTSEFGLRTETERGQIIGTPSYMSPEQGLNEPLSEASDWYSVGVMLFEALTGLRPFGGTYLDVLRAKAERDGPAPGEFVDDLPEPLGDLCEELLARDPEMRPSGAEVIARLNRLWPQGRQASTSAARLPSNVFVGRDGELTSLVEARGAVRGGHAVLAYVHGSSGIGKTALVGRFLDRLRRREPEVVVLTSRCYERESVSYKALDNIVDELSQYLRRLGPGVEQLVPRDAAALARLFPVLRRVEPIALSRDRSTEIADFQELRRRGFAAFRELMSHLASSRPVVLFIDDLHWGDVDSAALLTDLLRPPGAPPLLLIASYRTEEAATSAALKVLLPRGAPAAEAGHDVREIALGELTVEQARDLTTRLLGDTGPSRRADAIVHESGRSPFLIGELVRYAAWGGAMIDRPATPAEPRRAAAAVTLETVLREHTSRLAPPARRLLEVLAVFGRPLRTPLASQAAGLGSDEIDAVTSLRAAHLARTRATDAGSAIEVYHDRIRETVVSRLEPDALRSIHSRLAFALDAQRDADPETLLTHFQGAGLPDRAGALALEAAGRARDALAFDHAAKLYRTALELGTFDEAARRNVQVMLADALAAGGRGHDAAEAYLQAASGAAASRALELKRRAAEQLLRSGHLDEGHRVVRDVLDAMGMKLAESPTRALLSFLMRRLRVRLRGLEFRPRDESQIPAETLVRVDACWTVATALGVVDTIRGADFQGRHLLLALETGDRYRIARALAVEAVYAAVEGAHRRERHESLIARADALARETGHPQAIGLVAMARGAAAFLLGNWKTARDLLERAEPVLRERAGAWQIDTHLFHLYYLLTLFYLGDVGEVGRRLPGLIDEARDRDDVTAATNLRARASHIPALAADDPRLARDSVDAAMARWPNEGFHAQHSWELYARGEIDLYDGRGPDAWRYISGRWPALRRSMLLRVQGARIESVYLRARAAVAAAAVSDARSGRRKLLASAERDARRLARESAPWAAATADFIHGGASAVRGDLESARHRFERAEKAFHGVDMALHAMVARRRRGQLTAGGTALIKNADEWMAAQSIRNPGRMADMLAPGPELFSNS
jgi:serine/threonine protein kinase/tetratricopeptide (TPR) repeat protein